MCRLFPRVLAKWCGSNVSYRDGLTLQAKYLERHINNVPEEADAPKNVLLLLEHLPVYTVGVRSKDYTLDEENRLKRLGADFFRTDRGGLITYHGPGQLVVYPILDLRHFSNLGGAKGVRWYVCQLEKCLIDCCATFGLKADAPGPPLTGVWVAGRKIAAIGIHATKRTLVSHGIALNCNTDLSWFQQIVPCGLEGKEVTTLAKELGSTNGSPAVNDVMPRFIDMFAQRFSCEVIVDDDSTSKLRRIKHC